jgi:hypothetical protein
VGNCKECGGRAIGVQRVKVGVQTFTVTSDDLCESHGSVEQGVARHLAQGGPASGPGFRLMRGAVEMQATRLAELLGTRPATISQWETGAAPAVNVWAWTVLAAIVLEELGGGSASTCDRLKALHKAKHTKKSVSISAPKRVGSPPECGDEKRRALAAVIVNFVRVRHGARKIAEERRYAVRHRFVKDQAPEWRWEDDKAQVAKLKTALIEIDARIGKAWRRVVRALDRVFVKYHVGKATHAERGTGPITAAAEIAWWAEIEPHHPSDEWGHARIEVTRRFYNATRRTRHEKVSAVER